MKTEKMNLRVGFLAVIILLAALSRLLPHPPNFTPVAAMGLFGAAYFSRKWLAFIIPLAALWISDLVISNVVYAEYYDNFVLFSAELYWISASFILIALLGLTILKKVNARNVIGASLIASVIFFLITNFSTWYTQNLYPHDFAGLIACYVAGIPFFGNTVMGDLLYSGILFGGFELAKSRFPVLALSK